MNQTRPATCDRLLLGLLAALASLTSVSCSEAGPPSGSAGAGGANVTAGNGNGGTGVTAGSPGMAGNTTTSGSGGAATAGASGAGTGGGGGGATETTCTITVPPAMTSSEIATVGIVEFSTDLAGLSKAEIEFGPDTNYGMVAPVDLTAEGYRTLLLGMKQRTEYHFRVVATGTAGTCRGQDQTIMTGSLPNGFPEIEVETEAGAEASLYGGFLITGAYVSGGGGSGSPAYIVDKDGDVVWAFNVGSDVTGARLSYDGKFMWINKANVPSGQANVHRVSMDGMTDEDLSDEMAGLNHELTVLPDESIAYFAYGSNGCDDVKIRRPNGMVETLINSGTATGGNSCHCNGIDYSAEDNSLVVSELNSNKYFKVKIDDKSLVWVLGGSGTNDFTGDGSTWNRQHGVDVLAADSLVFFNNNAANMGGSLAVELKLDLTAKTATKVWTYGAMPAITNDIMGDVQRLKNGNTIVAYSTKGVVHEVSADGTLLEEWSWPIGGAFGYVEKRKTLYGPPEL
jgi:hypothetical protein